VLSDSDKRADYDAKRAPHPALDPAIINFEDVEQGCSEGPTVLVRLRNRGGIPATISVDPPAGRFWRATARGSRDAGVLAEFLVTAVVEEDASPGPHHETVTVHVDDISLVLTVLITVRPKVRPTRPAGPSLDDKAVEPRITRTSPRRAARGEVAAKFGILLAALIFLAAPFGVVYFVVLQGHTSGVIQGLWRNVLALACFFWFLAGLWAVGAAVVNLFD
jgi:hypothetical protein